MASDNILEAVDRIEQAIGKFERILYGDPQARQNGLLLEFEGLRKDVQQLSENVYRLQNRRPNVLMWVTGYVLFLVAGALATVCFINQVSDMLVWDLSPGIAGALAVIFAGIALFMFVGGFGWLDGRT
jgi:hypothetical protein